jgi:hypothetical protein
MLFNRPFGTCAGITIFIPLTPSGAIFRYPFGIDLLKVENLPKMENAALKIE